MLLTVILNATVVTWDGNVSNDWHDAANWDTNTIPSAGDDVIISGGATVNILSAATIKTLILLGGTTLNINNSAILTLQEDGVYTN